MGGQFYCKPTRTPITDFCTNLTGISDTTLKDAGSLADALGSLATALSAPSLAGRSICAVAHGSADLELMLPRNCRDQGLEVPPYLRRYVDLREATQSYLAAKGAHDQRGSTLRQICEAMKVPMLGEEHCGLDDSWMVLLAFQELLLAGATLRPVYIDAERADFLGSSCEAPTSLVLDGLPFFAVTSEVLPWFKQHADVDVTPEALSVILGLDGRPSGRAVVEFPSQAAAQKALQALDGGQRLTCGSFDYWPFEAPKERLILARPVRAHELRLPRAKPEALAVGGVRGPILAAFPVDPEAMDLLRQNGQPIKGRGKGGNRRPVEPAQNCKGTIKNFSEEKGYGFIAYGDREVFVHVNDCKDCIPPLAGDEVTFDVIRDQRNGKMKSIQVAVVKSAA